MSSVATDRDGRWSHVDEAREVPIEGDVTVPARLWHEHGDALSWRDGRTGVRLGPGDSLDALGPYLGRIALVVLEARPGEQVDNAARSRILRERYAYAGEIRPVEGRARQPRRVRGPGASTIRRRAAVAAGHDRAAEPAR